jgi:hypothetical protein
MSRSRMVEPYPYSTIRLHGVVLNSSSTRKAFPFYLYYYYWQQYCHVYGVPWLIITGSGLGDWIYWNFCYNYNQLQQPTISGCPRLAPFLTGLRVSSLPLWRMPNEEPLPNEFSCLTNALLCVKVKVKVTLRLTVSQSVSLGVEAHVGPMARYLLLV